MKQHLAGVSKRQQEIMEALRQQGAVAVDSLAKAMNVAHAEHTGDGMVASGMIRHSDGEVLDYDDREVCVAKAIIKHARSVILVTDSMKFERKASIRICNLSDVDYLVTDNSISEESLQMCESRDVHLRVVSISDDAQEKGCHVG